MRYGYMRVSTTKQETDLQRDSLIAAGIDPSHIYSDKMSGKIKNRPGLKEMTSQLSRGTA